MQPSVLVTGATGLLGRSCLPRLITRHGSKQIMAVVRPGRDVSSLVETGIRDQYRRLRSSLRMIIHSAADIRFNTSLEQSRRTNVEGTANLLCFAGRCTQLQKFAHISTAYVSGGRTGHILEEAAEPGPFFNSYQQSKFEAEDAVIRAMRRIPVSIYRFSTMIYNGTSGRVDQFNYFHQLLRLALNNPLHMIPANPEAPIDLILSDWATRVFTCLFEEYFAPGEIVHICAGREGSLTVGELFDITCASP
jgi:nucleoside-diphosphate-sugar epimerase